MNEMDRKIIKGFILQTKNIQMKLNTLFIVGACASTLLASCNLKTTKHNQLSLAHTTLVDGDAYEFFQLVGGKAVYESEYAAHVTGIAGSSQARQLAEKAQEVYSSMIPSLDSLAIAKQMDFPIRGAAQFEVPGETPVAEPAVQEIDNDEEDADLEDEVIEEPNTRTVTPSYSDAGYIEHVQHEAGLVKEQVRRMTRNTDREVRAFAETNLPKVTELFTLAGGQEDEHAHH